MNTETYYKRRIEQLERIARELELEFEVQQQRLIRADNSPLELVLVLIASVLPSAIGYLLAENLQFVPDLVNDAAPFLLIAALGWAFATAVLQHSAAARGSTGSYRYRAAVAQVQLLLMLAATAWLLYDKSRLSLEVALGVQLGFFASLASCAVHDLAQQFTKSR